MEKVKRFVSVFINLLAMKKFDTGKEVKKGMIAIYIYNVNGPKSVESIRSMILKCGFAQDKTDFYSKDGVRLTTTFMDNIGCGVLNFSEDAK